MTLGKIGTVTYFIPYVLFLSPIYFHKIGDCPHFPYTLKPKMLIW